MSSSSIPSTSTNTSLLSNCCYQEQSDGVIPDAEQIGSIYARSKQAWQELASSASTMSLTRDSIDLKYLSERSPELPKKLEFRKKGMETDNTAADSLHNIKSQQL
ncbi:hypothetical protein NOR_04995 [Metarhizium rileyi]|uniref:Uncharacterized protein n=1 Tax=Metarhizium rileyi (strain RCEF 4871) TaxID=1649241 RepID=A0A167DAN6_METRR|nr:hypothetical protein NOR_04995 [Metarhizium rileyi RCEF 4871]